MGSAAREEILARVRAALAGPPPAPAPTPRDYRRTGARDRGELVATFAGRLADYQARVHHATLADDREESGRPGPAELSTVTVARRLAGARTVVVPADLPGAWLSEHPGTVRRDGDPGPVPVADLDAPGVSVLTGCAAAIAETGTIVLDAGPAQGRRVLTLVPDHHVCLVRADQIVATVPEGLARLPDPTRPLTFVSGPSATSDIELDRVEGVHGPRHLDVIIAS